MTKKEIHPTCIECGADKSPTPNLRCRSCACRVSMRALRDDPAFCAKISTGALRSWKGRRLLTDDQVRWIRSHPADRYRELARELNCQASVVGLVMAGITYKDVKPEEETEE